MKKTVNYINNQNKSINIWLSVLAGLSSSMLTANAAVQVTGGDAGFGLTLDAPNVVGALNVGSGSVDPGGYTNGYTVPLVVQGVSFADDKQNPWSVTWAGFAGGGFIQELGGSFAFAGTSANDTNLSKIYQTLYFGSSYMGIHVGNLTPGMTYKFDVLVSLTDTYGGPRNLQVFSQILGQGSGTIQDAFSVTGGSGPGTGVAYNSSFLTLVGTDGKIDIGAIPGSSPNGGGWINGLVITQVPEPRSISLAFMGLVGWLGFRRFRCR